MLSSQAIQSLNQGVAYSHSARRPASTTTVDSNRVHASQHPVPFSVQAEVDTFHYLVLLSEAESTHTT